MLAQSPRLTASLMSPTSAFYSGAPSKNTYTYEVLYSMLGVGSTTAVTPLISRAEGASNSGAAAPAAQDTAGTIGLVKVTPGSTSGGRLCTPAGVVIPHATYVIEMEALVKFVTAGKYFVGLQTVTADQAATITSEAMPTGVFGVGFFIDTDNNYDFIQRGSNDTETTRSSDVGALTAATAYRLGLQVTTVSTTFYVDGTSVGTFAHATNTLTTALSPCCSAVLGTATKILSVYSIGLKA